MMKTLTITILFLISIMFNMSKTPLIMGLMLLLQTLSISILLGMLSMSFWFMYMLFLVMIGGMLILFIYMSSLTSNLKFNFNKKIIMMMFLLTIFLLTIFYNTKLHLVLNIESMSFMTMKFEQEMMLKMSLNKLYNLPSNFMMILMINYLLLTLFITVKITNINMGPLRKNI
uniref:NADH-ubiquinone oxidoreductase chain 6 n=1 Tax=Strongylogaster xanthocera TaxID=1385064 RepID=A0A7T8JJJ0_9HYME|nr:NADH dehydrogenase subunit 6 [Strongylogaster xanthocera]